MRIERHSKYHVSYIIGDPEVWICNECGKEVIGHEDNGEYNDCPVEGCCGCLNKMEEGE